MDLTKIKKCIVGDIWAASWEKDPAAVAQEITEQFSDNPLMVIEIVGLENLYSINFDYLTDEQFDLL